METTELSSKRKTRGKGNAKTKAKAASRRKNMQKPVYVFVQAMKNDGIYKDYFNPEAAVERRLLRLDDLVRTRYHSLRVTAYLVTQKPKGKDRKKKHAIDVHPAEP